LINYQLAVRKKSNDYFDALNAIAYAKYLEKGKNVT
jgi:hypothetical protein